MSIMDIGFITSYDLDWYGKSEGNIAHFASGGTDTIPDIFVKEKEIWEEINSFFDESPFIFEQEIFICNENLPNFIDENERNQYLESYVEIAKKGLYSYDIDFKTLNYKLVAYPLKIIELPKKIYDLLPDISLGVIVETKSFKNKSS